MLAINKRVYLIVFLPGSVLLSYVCSFYPAVIERYFSTGINRAVVRSLSAITGFIPFSLAEMLVILLVLMIGLKFGRIIITLYSAKQPVRSIIFHHLIKLTMFISVIYFAYILLWGLNYHRLSFANIANLTVQPATTEELASVCNSLIDLTNRLRTGLNENQNGVMIFPSGKASILMGAAAGYEQAGIIYPELQGRYGSPKGVLLSEPMSYLGLAGIYFPFTGEANVNMAVPDAMLPSAICHEMAHQRGFAREDETNYIAYLTCRLNPDPYFQYSGNLLALIVSMNTLNQYNPERYLELQAKYDPGIKKDLEYYALFWRNHETKLGDISNVANDLYLKSNHQLDGVYSYNRMINLLIAEYRSNGYI